MTYAVRVKDAYIGIMGRHVAEGQSIVPGAPLFDIMTPSGVVETVKSESWGIVAHIEGHRIHLEGCRRPEDDGEEEVDEEDDGDGDGGRSGGGGGGGWGAVFSKGDVICHIVARMDRSQRKAGLHPRPAPSVRFRRALAL